MNIALFLSSDGIALAHRQTAGHWAMIGETALDVPDLSVALSGLRDMAVERVGEEFEVLLVLPDDQILYTSLTAPTADPELTAFRIEEGLEGLTPYSVTELEYDWQVLEEDRVKIAVVARETLDEARGFAAQYGFVGKGFAAMPPMERFPGVPTFDLGDEVAAMGFTADGMAFGPDSFGMPEPEPEPEVVEEPEVVAPVEPVFEASEPVAEPEVALEPEPIAEPEPSFEEPEVPAAVVEASVEAVVETVVETVVEAAPEPEPIPEAEQENQNPALAEALMVAAQAAEDLEASELPVQAIEDPSISGPISPIAAEPEAPAAEADTREPNAAQGGVEDAGDGDDTLPPAPSAASREARQRARVIRGEPTAPTPPAPDASDTSDTGQFSARRGPTTAPEGARGSLIGQRGSRLGLTHPDGPARAAPSTTPPAPVQPVAAPPTVATPPVDGAPMPRLAEQLQRVRNASKTRPQAASGAQVQPPRPRVEIEPQPALGATGVTAERRPSPFDDPPAKTAATEGRTNRLGGMLGGLSARRSAAAEISEASADAAPAPERSGTWRRKTAATADGAVAEGGTFASGLLARKSVKPTGGSFRTGLVLTVILLLLLALVAIWSAVFLPNSAVARLFGMGDGTEEVAAASGGPAPNVVTTAPVIGTIDGSQPSLADEAAADGIDLSEEIVDEVIEVAAAPLVDEALPDIDAELDLPPLPPIEQGQNPSVEEAEALYAEDGIWARSPERPDLRPFDLQDQVYTASIDPEVSAFDAVALPDPGVNPGELLRRFPPPPAFGAAFDLTAAGLVVPTPEGVLTPEGAFVIAGPPPFASRPRPREVASTTPEIDVDDAILGTFRPAERPGDLSETRERQVLGGFTEVELGERRPASRPASPQEAAAEASLFPGGDGGADPEAVEAAVELALAGTELAIAQSLLPRTRPANIAQIVASADRTPTEAPTAVAVAAVASGPSIPSNADVSRAATERNAIRLHNVNLIGVSGTSSERRALVRLSSGRFVRVTVGDRLDGGRVAAVGETTLQYVRSGRTVTLEIPG